MTDWREQEVRNETQSREINEWIQQSNDTRAAGPTNPYICECSDEACASTISLTRIEYEEVRAYGTHFAIALDHETPTWIFWFRSAPGTRSSASFQVSLRGSRPHRIPGNRRRDRDQPAATEEGMRWAEA